jgi:hypothetical protein
VHDWTSPELELASTILSGGYGARLKAGTTAVYAELVSDERKEVNARQLDDAGCERHVHEGGIRRACFMLRRVVICLAFIVLGVSAGAAAERQQLNPVPFAHTPCSVLDEGPCTPSYCSVLNHGPCIPEMDYPYGENLQVTVLAVPPQDQTAKYKKPDHDLDTIGDLFAALRSCWTPPPADDAREGMQMSVRFSFKRSGEMIATPRMTFATAGVPADTRTTYLNAIDASLKSCLPLKFSSGLGGALAGRPIAIRYVDNRELSKQAEKP